MQRHSADDLTIFGVNTDDSPEFFRAQCEKLGVTWPNVFVGEEGRIPTDWGVDSFPTIFVLDRAGVIRAIDARGLELERVVGELIAEH